MAIGIGFANDEYEKSIQDYYEEELYDAPIGADGFVKDICYEERLNAIMLIVKPKKESRDLFNVCLPRM